MCCYGFIIILNTIRKQDLKRCFLMLATFKVTNDTGQFHNCQSWSFITVHGQFYQIDLDYIVSWQPELENTKENIISVCDKPYHKIKENMPLGEELKRLWNYPLRSLNYMAALHLKKANFNETFTLSVSPYTGPVNQDPRLISFKVSLSVLSKDNVR